MRPTPKVQSLHERRSDDRSSLRWARYNISRMLASQAAPVLVSAHIPVYPPLARQGRIEGIVKPTFTLGDNGEPIDVQVISAQALLRTAALENVQTWRFRTPYAEGKYETEFDFRFVCSAPQRVTFESFQRVEVVSCPPMHPSD
jgi:TonB family protein